MSKAIDALCADPQMRATLADRGRSYVRARHDPARVGDQFHDAIETLANDGECSETAVLDAIARISVPAGPDLEDLRQVTSTIALDSPRVGARQILYDVTVLAEQDARTGIQRVVRAILQHLVARPPEGYVIEPVRMDGEVLRYARGFAERIFDTASTSLPDEVCCYADGDIYLSIDWVPDRLPSVEAWLSAFRLAGGRIIIAVHDLLPFEMPQHFPDFMPNVMGRWFETALRLADQFVCVSAAVADDVIRIGTALSTTRHRRIAVDVVHNAADFGASLPTTGFPTDGQVILTDMAARPTFLMVGTVEPRKGHQQVVRGFDKLWREGLDVALLIVGKKGWMTGQLEAEIASHKEHNRRLRWMQAVSDEYLTAIYSNTSALHCRVGGRRIWAAPGGSRQAWDSAHRP